MKFKIKNRNVQQKYKEKIAFKNKKRYHTVEAVVVGSLIVVLVLLEVLYGNIFMSEDKNSAFIEQDYSEEDVIDHKWMQVIPIIDEELEDQYDVYSGVKIDFDPKPLKFIIKTTLKEESLENEEVLKQMNKITNKVIESYNLQYQNEAYEIIIMGEQMRVLNRSEFN